MGISVLLVVISTIIILASIIYVSIRKNKKQFHYVYILLMSSMLVWCIGAIGEVTTKNVYHFNSFVQTCNYFGIALVSVFILLLGIVFTRTKIIVTWKYALLFILPIGSAIAVATNESHHLFMKVFCIIIKDTVIGPLMWAHYVYCYLYISIGMGYLIKYAVNNSGLFFKTSNNTSVRNGDIISSQCFSVLWYNTRRLLHNNTKYSYTYNSNRRCNVKV